MDVVWLASLALVGGGLYVGARLVSVVVLLASVVLLFARGRPWLAVLLLGLFAVGAARATSSVAVHARAMAAAPRALPGTPRLVRCSIAGRVALSPTRVSARDGGESARLTLDSVRLSCDGTEAREVDESARALEGRVVLHADWSAAGGLVRGDRVEVFASVAEPQRFSVPELGDDRASRARGLVVLSGGAVDVVRVAEGRGPLAWIDHARAHVRRRILATFPPRAESMARALVLGETDLAPEDARDFRDGGLSHLLAVSGMHLVLTVNGAAAALTALFARLRWLALRVVPRRAASLVCLPICWIYCDFSGSSGSAVRAACMLSVQLLGVALGRRVRPLRALGWSVVIVGMLDPLAAVDVSFSLSAAATLGLVALGGSLADRLGSRGPLLARLAGKSFATTLAATIPCAPILLRMGPALSLGGLVANVLAVPIGEVAALPICLTHALLAPLPRAERGAALAGGGALLLVGRIAHVTAASRLGRVVLPRPSDAELGALAVLVLVATVAPRGPLRRAGTGAAVLALVLAEVQARRTGAPRGVLRVTFLDVGQGDAALVDLPSGEALLIDAGGLVGSPVDPGERVVAPLLRARRRSELAAVIVSHPHPDHFMGLRAGLEGVRIAEVWDTGEVAGSAASGGSPGPFGPLAYMAVLGELEARGARVRRPEDLCGTHTLGGAEVTVLAPCPSFAEGRGTNDNSFVVRLRYGATTILLVGDAEHAAEGDLVTRSRAGAISLRADVLKVGHHGSRTSSTPTFLEAVAPRFAVVSCGNRNRYGHPHVPTLEALTSHGIELRRTDCHGTITATTNGETLTVTAADPAGCESSAQK